jgi:23S rRNA (uridine2552-2'-O)-methyltransferase
MSYRPRDHYFHKAKQQKFVARSAFKLEEIDQRFHIFRPGQIVLDLGAAPGSWSQYAAKKIGSQGHIFGIDLKPVTVHLPNAQFIVGDILQIDLDRQAYDVVMSDMAPSTTGIKSVDQIKSLELCEMALKVSQKNLKKGGVLICKLFHSNEFEKFRHQMRTQFAKVEALRPDSTRSSSKEIFLIGIKKLKGSDESI